MKSLNVSRLFGPLLIVLSLVSCEETTSLTPALLCTPAIGEITPPSGSLSTAGGAIQITGHNFWKNYSETTTADDTPVPYTAKYDVVLLLGSQTALVTEAYEQTIALDPSTAPRDLDGNLVPSTCETCTACITANGSAGTGCGGCEAECMGCQQVISAQLPAVSPSDAEASPNGSFVTVPLTVISGINYSPTVYYDFTNYCDDGLDNDDDGLIDSADPDCTASGGASETGS